MSRGCGCSSAVASGCQCTYGENDCFEFQGSGSPDNPVLVVPKFNPDPDNLLECTEFGLLAKLPAPMNNPPRAFVYRNTDLNNIEDATTTVVEWDGELSDAFGMHAANDFNLIVPEDGWYHVFASLYVQPETTVGLDTATIVSMTIRKNSVLIDGERTVTTPGDQGLVSFSCGLEIPAEVGDSFDVTIRHGYDVQGRVISDGYISHFGAVWQNPL